MSEDTIDLGRARELLEKTTSANLASYIAGSFDFPMPQKWNKAERVDAIMSHCEEDEEAQAILAEIIAELEDANKPAEGAKSGVRPIPTRGAGEIICKAIQEYVEDGEDIDEDEILASVKNHYPNQNPGPSAIAYYKTLLRNNGIDIPGGRGKKATVTETDAETEQEEAA